LLDELEAIVNSGTRINIQYYIDDVLDEDAQQDVMDYFMQSESDSLKSAEDHFDGDYEEEELRLMRIKFMSEIAN
jgi:ATP-dependent DNA helicase RecQ